MYYETQRLTKPLALNKMKTINTFIILTVLTLTSCNQNSQLEELRQNVDSLETLITNLENNLDTMTWNKEVMQKVNTAYEELLSREGIEVGYSIQEYSSIIIEIIEDDKEELIN